VYDVLTNGALSNTNSRLVEHHGFKVDVVSPQGMSLHDKDILIYVDYILCIHHNAMTVLNKLDKYFTLKPTSVGLTPVCIWGPSSKSRN
jgi:hypothetical protein